MKVINEVEMLGFLFSIRQPVRKECEKERNQVANQRKNML